MGLVAATESGRAQIMGVFVGTTPGGHLISRTGDTLKDLLQPGHAGLVASFVYTFTQCRTIVAGR